MKQSTFVRTRAQGGWKRAAAGGPCLVALAGWALFSLLASPLAAATTTEPPATEQTPGEPPLAEASAEASAEPQAEEEPIPVDSAEDEPPSPPHAGTEDGKTGARKAEAAPVEPPKPVEPAMRGMREMEAPNGFVAQAPTQLLEWHGGLQLDGAYANYSFSDDIAYEQLYDLRGRFVVGPTINHYFGKDYFVQARVELVGWARERENVYQLNVDDVYGRAGKKGVWDVAVGRFFSWRVYHRGRGFDLFTVEDLGACRLGNCASQNGQSFAPHMYEVNNIYMRGTPGRVAAHFYPWKWAGIELLAEYGSTDTINVLGGRAAATARTKYFRLSGAAEYRSTVPTKTIAPTDQVTGAVVPCPICGTGSTYGFGGGAEVTLGPVEAGFNIAQGTSAAFAILDAAPDLGGTGSVLSMGGYGELDVGSFWKSHLIFGGGLNWTQRNTSAGDWDGHQQVAAYVAYPLGFNNAEVKLVASRATLDQIVGSTLVESFTESNALRLRFLYPF